MENVINKILYAGRLGKKNTFSRFTILGIRVYILNILLLTIIMRRSVRVIRSVFRAGFRTFYNL